MPAVQNPAATADGEAQEAPVDSVQSASQLKHVIGDEWDEEDTEGDEEDTNAVLAKFPCEQRLMGKLLAKSNGDPSIFMRIVQVAGVLVSIFIVSVHPEVYAEMSGHDEPSGLLMLSGVCVGIAILFLQSVFVSAHRGLAHGGALTKIGIENVKVSESAHQGYSYWRFILGLLGLVGAIFFGTLCFGVFLPAADTDMQIAHAIISGIFSVAMWPSVMFWWASMRLASTLCRDHTIEVRQRRPTTYRYLFSSHGHALKLTELLRRSTRQSRRATRVRMTERSGRSMLSFQRRNWRQRSLLSPPVGVQGWAG